MTQYLIQYHIKPSQTTSWFKTWSFSVEGAAQAAQQEARYQYSVLANDVVILQVKEAK